MQPLRRRTQIHAILPLITCLRNSAAALRSSPCREALQANGTLSYAGAVDWGAEPKRLEHGDLAARKPGVDGGVERVVSAFQESAWDRAWRDFGQQAPHASSSGRSRLGFTAALFVTISVLVFVLALVCLSVVLYQPWRQEDQTSREKLLQGSGSAQKRSIEPLSSSSGGRPSTLRAASPTLRAMSSSICEQSRVSSTCEGTEDCSSGSEGNGRRLPKVLLCPLLLVPRGTRLDCLVQKTLCRRKQDEAFSVRGISGCELFEVRATEVKASHPGIYMETLGGRALLAFMSTEELWRGSGRPELEIFHAGGAKFGSMQKTGVGEYVVQDEDSVKLKFVGDFVNHSYKVLRPSGHTVASVSLASARAYKVVVHSQSDAGIMILGALAIDKCETPPDPPA